MRLIIWIILCINSICQKRSKKLKNIHNFSKKNWIKNFSKDNLNRIFYYNGKQTVIDILNYHLKSQKIDNNIIN